MLNTLLNLEEDNLFEDFSINDIGDNHLYTNLETPLKSNAFEISDDEKKEKISVLFAEIMDVMGMDLNDDSLKGTPERV
ncbi:MAG: GTP cyclohydrolase I FolE, partial [Lutibacter sp.]|nr:GTP cyclohydrolase I FolE [Lutibacter sp.]